MAASTSWPLHAGQVEVEQHEVPLGSRPASSAASACSPSSKTSSMASGSRSPNAIRISCGAARAVLDQQDAPRALTRGHELLRVIGAPPRPGDRPRLSRLDAGGREYDARAVIARYTRPELGELWTDQAKMDAWRDVEVAAAEALDGPTPSRPGGDPGRHVHRRGRPGARAGHRPRRRRVRRRAGRVAPGEAGRWIHFGLTSSDVLDTALALQLRRAGRADRRRRARLRGGARRAGARARGHAVRRPHPRRARRADQFGLKLAGFALEAHRNAERLERAFAQAATGRDLAAPSAPTPRSGPTSSAACSSGSACAGEPVSTQVVPRDRHAELLSAIALAGAGLERFATEIRHLQRTEVREVEEPFRAGQKGSSAMPHKRNPITTERITGLARVLRGYAQTGLENVALWHERDISHSGAERVVLPDATILLDYMQHLALRVARGMTVHADRMAANLEITSGALFSQRVLLALVSRAGCSATTPTGSSSASPSRRGTRARRCGHCSSRSPASSSTSTPCSTTPTTSGTSRKC